MHVGGWGWIGWTRPPARQHTWSVGHSTHLDFDGVEGVAVEAEAVEEEEVGVGLGAVADVHLHARTHARTHAHSEAAQVVRWNRKR
jgi:hypothetical protein